MNGVNRTFHLSHRQQLVLDGIYKTGDPGRWPFRTVIALHRMGLITKPVTADGAPRRCAPTNDGLRHVTAAKPR